MRIGKSIGVFYTEHLKRIGIQPKNNRNSIDISNKYR